MRVVSEIVLAVSQLCFATAYIYFVATQFGGEGGVLQCMTSVLADPDDCSDGFIFDRWYWMPIILAVLAPLMFIRHMKVFAWTYLFVDIALIFSLAMIVIYST